MDKQNVFLRDKKGKIDLFCHPIWGRFARSAKRPQRRRAGRNGCFRRLHSVHSACGASDIILLFSGIDGFYCLLLALHMYVCMCRRFFENQTNEICSHSIEKPSKGRFFKPDKLQNHTNEGKGKEKRKSQEKERRKREKSNGCALSIYNGYFGDRFWPKINCWAEEVYFAITFSKIWPDVCMCINIRKNLMVLAGDESTFFNQ